jgi:hypothetical protein
LKVRSNFFVGENNSIHSLVLRANLRAREISYSQEKKVKEIQRTDKTIHKRN